MGRGLSGGKGTNLFGSQVGRIKRAALAADGSAGSEDSMSAQAKTSYSSTLALILLGIVAMYVGARWLPVLIPAAIAIWYGVPMIHVGRN